MAYHRKSAPPQGRRPDGTYGDLIPVSDEDGAMLLKENKKSVEFLFDSMDMMDRVPDDKTFRLLWRKVKKYAKDFDHEEDPFDDWGVNAIYDTVCNQLNIFADKWLDSWQRKSRGGKNSAAGRAAKREKQDKTNDSTSNKPIPSPQYADDMLLETALESGTIKEVLQGYAKQHNLWIPPDALCRLVSQYIDMFHGNSLATIHTFLRREFEDASDEDDNEMTADMYDYYRRYREGMFKL